jgi:hypothetical protein
MHSGSRFSPVPDIPPDDHMTKGELLEYHQNNGSMGRFYELYPESRPRSEPRRENETRIRELAEKFAPQQQTPDRQREPAQER